MAIALLTLVYMFLNEAYRPGLWGALIWYALGVLYFAVAGWHKLVLSPEERSATEHPSQMTLKVGCWAAPKAPK
jgi:ethanolamine permease